MSSSGPGTWPYPKSPEPSILTPILYRCSRAWPPRSRVLGLRAARRVLARCLIYGLPCEVRELVLSSLRRAQFEVDGLAIHVTKIGQSLAKRVRVREAATRTARPQHTDARYTGSLLRLMCPDPTPCHQPEARRPRYELPPAHPHSTTSVTCSRICGGNVMPRARAVFRFTTNSKVIGCSTGRSAGFLPLRMRST
jgi:hypothetical protein